jgi:hypothetical protein
MAEVIKLNQAQQISVVQSAPKKIDIWGRGTGKSFLIGHDINMINQTMPRALTSVTGLTYGQLLTRTLPSTFNFLEEKLGYKKHVDKSNPGNYVVGQKPPPHFILPYEKIMRYENVISFSNGNALLLLSQDKQGSSRGPNVDYEIVDEALTINKERYDQETSPTNRGHEELWGPRGCDPVPWHHGFHYVSSMPYSNQQKWLLNFADYYEEEAGVQLFSTWNRIVKMQMQLIEAKIADDIVLFKNIWNETIRLKKQITPFISKTGVLFTLSNALDNIQNVGFSYLMREYEKQTTLTFMIELMNMFIDKVEDCFYHIDERRHVYYDAFNDDFIRNYAQETDWDFGKLGNPDSRFDLDCNPLKPIEVCPDWQAKIALFTIGQESNYNFVTKRQEKTDCIINEFFVKPNQTSKVIIDAVVDNICDYYQHTCRKAVFFRDRYGDKNQLNANKSISYNQQAMNRFRSKGWEITERVHSGMEPPQHDKKLLWDNIFRGSDPRYPTVIINGKNCKYTLISMNNTRVKDFKGKYEKDKSSERSSSILPEEATHFGDAVDKRIWTKYGDRLKKSTTFVSPRL